MVGSRLEQSSSTTEQLSPCLAMLQVVERLSANDVRALPPNAVNPIAWMLWHIAEVED